MIKYLTIVILLTTLSACVDKTMVIMECKDGILHYNKVTTNVETGYIYQNSKQSGIVQYEDKSVVKCIK